MIAQLRPRSHREYLELPLFGPHLDDFVTWSLSCGYTTGTVKNQLKDTRHIVALLGHRGVERREQLTGTVFQEAWEHFRHDRPAIAGTVRQLEAYCIHTGWLAPSPQREPSNGCFERFVTHLEDIRGLGSSALQAHSRYVGRFLEFVGFGTDTSTVGAVELRSVEEFVEDCSRTHNRQSLQHVVGYLRAFLRFLYSEGELDAPLHQMLDSPRVYRQEKLPSALSREMVEALLGAIDRTNPHGIRNHAMLLLIATYGLRSCEVVSLKLEDIRWRSMEIRLPQSKNGNVLTLPLTDGVATSLIDYLSNARPGLPQREVFLRVRAPLGTLEPTAVADVFQREARLSGLDIPCTGAHRLRHSFAVHLLRQGNSVKTIGDILGHRSAESTCVYLRLATDDLRCVALEVPECPEIEIRLDPEALNALPRTRTVCDRSVPGPLRSPLAEDIEAYLRLHRSLGKLYAQQEQTLRSLDAFLADECPVGSDLNGEHFDRWCGTLARYASTHRRGRMLAVRKFCLYRQRSRPTAFVPDPRTFPPARSQFRPFILSTSQAGCLLSGASRLPPSPSSPLRSEVVQVAILLLFTAGLRRGELLRLTIGDFDETASTLFVGPTKFHKERLLPLSVSTAEHLRAFLDLRRERGTPAHASSPIIWNRFGGSEGRAYTGTALRHNWRLLCLALGILTPAGLPPRIHDVRHSFAVNALLRWYENGAEPMAKLPQLSIYMGHVSIASTQHYLHFVEPIRSAAGDRFENACGTLGTRDSIASDPSGVIAGRHAR